jgi:hypothetical protein
LPLERKGCNFLASARKWLKKVLDGIGLVTDLYHGLAEDFFFLQVLKRSLRL